MMRLVDDLRGDIRLSYVPERRRLRRPYSKTEQARYHNGENDQPIALRCHGHLPVIQDAGLPTSSTRLMPPITIKRRNAAYVN